MVSRYQEVDAGGWAGEKREEVADYIFGDQLLLDRLYRSSVN